VCILIKIYITGCGIGYDRSFYEGKGILLNNKEKFDFEKSYPGIIDKNINPLTVDHMNGFINIC
jgi:hypothetical protein